MTIDEEFDKLLKQFHKLSDRHILVADDYIKKKLSDRMYKLTDGTLVQRDWYSSFLLYCYDFKTNDIVHQYCCISSERLPLMELLLRIRLIS